MDSAAGLKPKFSYAEVETEVNTTDLSQWAFSNEEDVSEIKSAEAKKLLRTHPDLERVRR